MTGEHIPPRRILAFLAMVFGMFMAILDIQIVSASLAEIQAGLGASADEISWVQTAYLIAEVVMIPLSGFLGRVLSTRLLFTASAAGFTLASLMVSTSGGITEMIIWRAVQGFVGGAMIPAVFAAAFSIFPRSKQAFVSPMIGLVATLAPTIGPTIGGYLSHALSWHWLFLINVPFGILVTIAAWTLIDFDKPDFGLIRRFDWWGLGAMATFLGALEFVLEEGPGDDWFDDGTIVTMALVMAAGGAAFFWRALTRDEPIVDLRAFRDVNFAFGSLFSFVLGVGLYGLTYLYPLYLGRIRGHDSLMIGETMFVSGLSMFLAAPLVGVLSRRIDLRLLMLAGFAGFALSTWMLTGMTADWDFDQLLVPQVLRGVSLMFSMVPINNLALGTLPPERLKNASGLYNLMRNLGGAVGLALINTLLANRGALHSERLAEAVNWANPAAMAAIDTLARGLSAEGLDGRQAALAAMAAQVTKAATVMSFIDVFTVLAGLFVSLTLFVALLKKPAPRGGPSSAH